MHGPRDQSLLIICVIAAGLLRAPVLDEASLYQHLDMPLDRLGGNSRLVSSSKPYAFSLTIFTIFNKFQQRICLAMDWKRRIDSAQSG